MKGVSCNLNRTELFAVRCLANLHTRVASATSSERLYFAVGQRCDAVLLIGRDYTTGVKSRRRGL